MWALVVTVPAVEAEVAADVLWSLGVRAVEERVAGDGVELWTHVGDSTAAMQRADALVAGRWPIRRELVDETPADTWRVHAEPMWVDPDFVVVPAWQDPPTPSPPTVVFIEPGGAFGLGDHPTTLLCLRAARRLLGTSTPDVLDVGCGTGVIAIAAAMLLGRPVRAVDVASAAVDATRDNARRNQVDALVDADDMSLTMIDATFDVVFANILAPTLVELAGDLQRVTRPTGRLVISGILDGGHDHVIAALAAMEVERTDVEQGWAAVTLRHRAT